MAPLVLVAIVVSMSVVVVDVAAYPALESAQARQTMGPARADTPEAGHLVDDAAAMAIDALLARRSAAVIANDAESHASTFSESAPDRLRETASRTLDGAMVLGLSHYSERLARPAVDLTPPGDADGRVVAAVRREHRVEGIDETTHVSHLFLTFEPGPDGWRVLADDALAPIGVFSERELWELRPVDIVRTERSVVVGTAPIARLQQLADLLATAMTRFDEQWGQAWVGRVVMLVPNGLAETEELLRPTVDASKFIAFTTLDVDLEADNPDRWQIVAPRIVAQESNLAARSPERQIDVLVHELAHVASVEHAGPLTPLWMHEGLADWVTEGRPLDEVGDDGVTFPDLHLFRTGTVSEIRSVYAQAASTMAQLAGTFGADTPWQLFTEVGSVRTSPGTSDRALSDVIAAVTGVSAAELLGVQE